MQILVKKALNGMVIGVTQNPLIDSSAVAHDLVQTQSPAGIPKRTECPRRMRIYLAATAEENILQTTTRTEQ